MTLPPNCLSAEPAAPLPGNSIAGLDATVASPAGAAASGTPFSSLLTQADGTGANAGAPAGEAVPTVAASNSPVATPVTMYPGTYYMSFSPPAVALSTVPGVPVASAPAQTQVPAQVLAQAQATSPDVGLTDAGTTAEITGEKPETPGVSAPKGKQKSSEQAKDASSSETTSGAMQMAYQLIAGQWVPQPVAQPTEQAQPPADDSMVGASGASGTLATSGEQANPAQTKAASSSASTPSAQQMTYQLIAGQWVPQPVAQGPIQVHQVQAPAENLAASKGAGGPPVATAVVAAGGEVDQYNQPVPQNQKAGSGIGEPVQNRTDVPASGPVSVVGSETTTTKEANPSVMKSEAATLPVASGKNETPGVPPVGQDNSAAPATKTAQPDTPGTQSPNWRLAPDQSTQIQSPENFAAPSPRGRADFKSGVKSSEAAGEKKTLTIDGQEIVSAQKDIGTDVANRESAMPYSASNKPATVDFSTLAHVDSKQGTQASSAPAVTGTNATPDIQAPRLVQEIRAIADRISVIDRNSVEVRFDFSNTDRLSVRVEYRDGTVHTTFRTDSPQLRDAISHEWQSQAAAAEQRPYRVADPVFSQTVSNRQNYSSSGDGSERQRAFEQPAPAATTSYAATGRNTGSTASVAVPAARSFRPETSLHLHTFA